MKEITYSEIVDQLEREDLNSLPVFKIAVLRSIMADPLAQYLRFQAYREGLNAVVRWGNYDNVIQDASGASELTSVLLNDETSLVIILLRLENVSWKLSKSFAALTPEAVKEESQRVLDYCAATLDAVRQRTAARVIWTAFELPSYPALGVMESQGASGQEQVIRSLNDGLRELLRNRVDGYFLDLNLCRMRLGDGVFFDQRYWHMARSPYSLKGQEALAEEVFRIVRPLIGKNRKCLALDGDNVLWGGIIGEDGMAGIKLSSTHPGSAFQEFQEEVLNLYHRGIILALCSKNNEADFWEVFRNHPGMLLREEHISSWRINWNDKTTNLREIASELNIGLDSIVFVDDSEFEINLVRDMLPEVSLLHLPVTEAVHNARKLAACGLFETLALSHEDRERGSLYRAEVQRRKFRQTAVDLNAYLISLEMVLTVDLADSFTLPRVAQLTQRTNQFNLTTRRYSESEISFIVENPVSDVLCLHLSDRFGDSGLVGVAIVVFEQEKARIDTFLVSCRVLGRKVEDAFLAQVLAFMRLKGARTAVGEYIPTTKNSQVRNFFPDRGFLASPKKMTGVDGIEYICDLDGMRDLMPHIFKEIKTQF
ncbi:HAD-IIIC family phosphatase [bacterium]|nr:HAD-IIIC family phosphatase [bacterium]